MSKEMKHALSGAEGLIPKLRFPEFEDDGEWERKTLEHVADSESSNLALNKIEHKENGYPVYGADSIVGYIDEYQQEEKYISIVKDGSGVGRLNLCKPKSSILGTLACIKSKDLEEFNLDWIYYQLNTVDFTSYKKGSGIPHIYFSDFKIEPIGVPNPSEQHKIASCLSSLDELIAAHNEKLDALKDHKKGLLQNLFPNSLNHDSKGLKDEHDFGAGIKSRNQANQKNQGSDNVPKVRFPEFEDDGEWVEDILDNLAAFSKGKGISKSDIVENGKIPCIRYGELYTQYNETIGDVISYTNLDPNDLVLSDANDVIIPASGETQIDIATASCVLKPGIALGGDLNIIKTEINGVFLAYYLNSAKKKDISQVAQGISVVHLYSSQLKTLTVNIPSPQEQKKIASCLSAVDELITAQQEKIEQLQQHKKGLMQGLFPKII
ncbi:MAG: restriction endonuclease subunit S [Bacteroidales bacterium]|jgi:type I restriction enzyme S subunit|nr:restriction endonuclease subunit S [Bacteroidales bacterium]